MRRLPVALIALALASCSPSGPQTAGTVTADPTSVTPSAAAPPETSPTTTTTTAPTTSRPIDIAAFDKQISAFALPEIRPWDIVGLIAVTPYFVVGKLVAASPSDVYTARTFRYACEASEGRPTGSECTRTDYHRGVRLTFEVSDFRPLAAATLYPGRVEVGGTIGVDFFLGAYTTEKGQTAIDEIILKTVDNAPLGKSFAMFVGPAVKEGKWNVTDSNAWAYVNPDGSLSAVKPTAEGSPPPSISTVSLEEVLAEIVRQAASR